MCQEVLFPIFAPLRSGPMQEEMSFWVSTTMISALRNLVDLYTFYFEILERFLDPLLDLLCFCIDQGQCNPFPSMSPFVSSKLTALSTWAICRERHAGSDRDDVLPAAAREQRPQAEPRKVGAHRLGVRPAVPDHTRPHAVRREPPLRE